MEGRILEGKGGARAFRQTVNLLFFLFNSSPNFLYWKNDCWHY